MKFLFHGNRLPAKFLCLVLSFAFFILTVSCSHAPRKSMGKEEVREGSLAAGVGRSAQADSGEDPWWKRPEYEWMIVTLVVIGVGIAAGGAIAIASGSGGLSVRVQK